MISNYKLCYILCDKQYSYIRFFYAPAGTLQQDDVYHYVYVEVSR